VDGQDGGLNFCVYIQL